MLREKDVVFHCSGALSSVVLAAAKARGAQVASVHPLKSFASPASSVATFSGTYCALEGDAAAVAELGPAFRSLGGHLLAIEPGAKTAWHAGAVMVCEKVTGLLQAAIEVYALAGIDQETALRVMRPLVTETVENVCSMGPRAALTGPVARSSLARARKHITTVHSAITLAPTSPTGAMWRPSVHTWRLCGTTRICSRPTRPWATSPCAPGGVSMTTGSYASTTSSASTCLHGLLVFLHPPIYQPAPKIFERC